jgi:hypothetical protein
MSTSVTFKQNRVDTTYNGSTERTVIVPTVHSGPGVPASSLGQDGDIYIVTG